MKAIKAEKKWQVQRENKLGVFKKNSKKSKVIQVTKQEEMSFER